MPIDEIWKVILELKNIVIQNKRYKQILIAEIIGKYDFKDITNTQKYKILKIKINHKSYLCFGSIT